MEGQEFLYQAVNELIGSEESENTIQHLSRTSMIEPRKFPAVIIEDEPYNWNQEVGQNNIIVRKQNFSLAVIIMSHNINDITEDKYLADKNTLENLTKEIVSGILERVSTYDKIANLEFGTGEIFDGKISSVPVMWNMIPVKITLVN